MAWVLSEPGNYPMEIGEIAVNMNNKGRGRTYFGHKTVVAWGLGESESMDILYKEEAPNILLFQFRKDKGGAYKLHKGTGTGRGFHSFLLKQMKKSGAVTSHYRMHRDNGVITVDLSKDTTTYKRERDRRLAKKTKKVDYYN